MPPQDPTTEKVIIEPQSDAVDNNPFRIDFTNRKIGMQQGIDRATSTRKFMKMSPAFLLSGTLFADTAVTTVVGGAAETVLGTFTVPLNMISRNYAGAATATGPKDFREIGNVFRMTAAGVFTTASSGPTVDLIIDVDGTEYQNFRSNAGSFTAQAWNMEFLISVTSIGSTGAAEAHGWSRFATAFGVDVNPNAAAEVINTTTDSAFTLSAVWSGGAAAGNTITIRQFLLEILN